MKILVTGGAGFIGSAVVRHIIRDTDWTVANVDKLTYAGNLESLAEARDSNRHTPFQGRYRRPRRASTASSRASSPTPSCISPPRATSTARSTAPRPSSRPMSAAPTRCSRPPSPTGASSTPRPARASASSTSRPTRCSARSGATGKFSETTPYAPNSPYAASKAASDHLVRAWHHTYGLPTLATNCSNNYGPYHFPEKLIPLIIIRALRGESLPVYGKGENVRDWLHVEDHAEALTLVLRKGRPGETYNVGGDSERKNIDVVRTICRLLDEMLPDSPHRPHEKLIEFVTDRPGPRCPLRHRRRQDHDASSAGSRATASRTGLRQTVRWYPRPQGLVGAGHERRLSRGAAGLG